MLSKAKFLLFTFAIAGASHSFAQQGNSREASLAQQASYIEPASNNLSAVNKNSFIKDAAINKAPAAHTVNDSLNALAKANSKTAGGGGTALPKNTAGSNGNNMGKGFSALANNTTGIDNTAH